MLFIDSLPVLTVLAIAVDAVKAPQQSHLSTDTSTSVVPAITTCPQHQEPFNVQQRDIPQPTVNYESMPTCAMSNCVYPASTATPLACESTSIPCPTGGSGNCSTVSLSCYCNLRTPLDCAWGCGWTDWMLAENWYGETCPNVKPISYDFVVNSTREHVPSCAADCLPAQVISQGCTSESVNCFCNYESLFGCTSTCTKAGNATIAHWLVAACGITYDTAMDYVEADTASDSTAKDGGPQPPTLMKPLHWYEIMPITVFSASVVAFLAITLVRGLWARSTWVKRYLPWLSKRKGK